MRLPFKNNPVRWKDGGLHKAFFPKGAPSIVPLGKRVNPVKTDLTKEYGPTWTARFLVGLSVNGVETYSMDHLISLTRKYLRENGIKEDASFIAQKGVYTHEEGPEAGKVVQENSAQVVLIYLGTPALEEFVSKEGFCVKLAEHICTLMKQETIIVQIQKNGVEEATWSVCA